MTEHYIVIDCQPGYTRPDDVLKRMCDILLLDFDMFEIKHKFFGEWTWLIKDNTIHVNKREDMVHFLKKCYSDGIIRYAEL